MVTNALAPRGASPSTFDSEGELDALEQGLFLIYYVRLVFEAEARGRPIAAPARLAAYMRRFNQRVLKAMACTRTADIRRSLNSGAKGFRQQKGWRAEYPEHAALCAQALESLSRTLWNPEGNPQRRRGHTTKIELLLVSEVFESIESEMGAIALAQLLAPNDKWVVRKRHEKVGAQVMALAKSRRTEVDQREVRAQIRQYMRTALRPSCNALRHPKKFRYVEPTSTSA